MRPVVRLDAPVLQIREIAAGQYVACHFPLTAGESLPTRNGQSAGA